MQPNVTVQQIEAKIKKENIISWMHNVPLPSL